MKALVFDKLLRYEGEHPDPKPAAGEVLVRVRMAGICATDLEIIKGYMKFRGIPGHEFVGEVVSGSSKWKGKRVVGEINCVCGACDMCRGGLASHCRQRTVVGISGRDGAMAEYVVLPEQNLHEVPEVIPDEQAVFVEPLAAAMQVLKQCPIEPRMNVSVVGSGRLGLLAAQVLQSVRCRVEVVGRNPQTLAFCERHGIQTVDVKQLVPRGDRDVVVECTGEPQGLNLAMQMVRPRGVIVLKSTYAGGTSVDLAPLVIKEVTVMGSRCGPFREAIDLLARQQIDVATMISRTYRLEQGIEAFTAAGDPQNIKVLIRMY